MTPTDKARVLTNLNLLEQRLIAVNRALIPKDPSVTEYLLPGKVQSATGRMSSEPQIQELPK